MDLRSQLDSWGGGGGGSLRGTDSPIGSEQGANRSRLARARGGGEPGGTVGWVCM